MFKGLGFRGFSVVGLGFRSVGGFKRMERVP